jgi:ABC-2 type transport system permease protein
MNLRRTGAMARKEWIQIRRDPLSLIMAFLLPAMLLFIYAYAITFDVDNIHTIVYDGDKSSTSRELIARFTESTYFNVVGHVDSYPAVDRYLDAGKAKVALIIPSGFEKKFHARRAATMEVIIDGSESNTANITQGYVYGVMDRFTRHNMKGQIEPLVDVRSRVWYNPELKSRNFIIPGLIAIIMSVVVSLLIALTVAREWERGTMEQLISTPVRPVEVVIGKMVPYFVIGFADTVVSVALAALAFGVPLRGSVPFLLAVSCIFLFGGLSFGILISIAAKDQLLASQASLLTSFLPSFLLSGFVFAISNMPPVLQVITYLFPARYFVSVLKGVFLKGTGPAVLGMEVVFLSLYGVVVFVVAVRKLHKRIE